MIDAWASMKSFRAKDGSDEDDGQSPDGRNGEHDFRGQKRKSHTHASTTDPAARLYRKSDGQPARFCYLGHVMMENRNGLVVDAELTQASGTAEREAALVMVDRYQERCKGRITLGADKAYDTLEFVADLRKRKVTPHIARKDHVTKIGKRRKSAIDGRTLRHPGYEISQRIRKRVEEPFSWIKSTAGLAKTRLRGKDRVEWMFLLTLAEGNLVRLRKLLPQGGV